MLKKRIYFRHLEVKFNKEKTKESFINYLLVFDDVVNFLSFDVPECIVVDNLSARSFTVNA
jgi:hypothetical protein